MNSIDNQCIVLLIFYGIILGLLYVSPLINILKKENEKHNTYSKYKMDQHQVFYCKEFIYTQKPEYY